MVAELFKLEWSKFRKNTTISLLMVFFLLFFPACLYFGRILDNIPDVFPVKVNIYEFPSIWEYLGYAGNWIVFFFLGVLVIYTVTIEVSNKTMRQAIIMGMSRKKFFIAKVMNVLWLSLFATLFYFLLSLVFGIIQSDEVSFKIIMDNDLAIIRFFLMCFGYLSFALFLAFLFRKAGLAVFFYISYVIIIEPLLKSLTRKYLFSNDYLNYFPLNAMEDLMPMPLFKYAEKLPNDIDYTFLLSHKEAIILTIVYSAIFLGFTYFRFLKKDI